MFRSYFPSPKAFFWSALVWFLVCLALWHGVVGDLYTWSPWGAPPAELAPGERGPFLTQEKVWVYLYIVASCVLFSLAWIVGRPHRWSLWSVGGSAFIVLSSYFSVQVSVWMNTWYGEFYDLIQKALGEANAVTADEFNGQLVTVFYVLVPTIVLQVLIAFFTQHYVFRWRTAMNEYYMGHWQQLRHVEGASQRVQEDTMRFAGIVEGLGSAFISSVMTLLAFLPLLWELSARVTQLPVIGEVNGSMVWVALLSAAFGTVLLATVGYRLPGLEFENQKVEAAYRKELVYGEDAEHRADPPTIRQLFGNVRRNYFRLYFNYMYFNVFRYAYLQGAAIIPYIALGPTLVAAGITFGIFQQILNAFNRVENSFQFLANAWTTIVELLSIHKRLKAFESAIEHHDDAELEAAMHM